MSKKRPNFRDKLIDAQINKGTIINFSNLDVVQLPDELFNSANLIQLYLSGNNISELPDEIENLTNLSTLYLGRNKLSQLPKRFQNLTKLTNLNLYANEFEEFPQELCNLTNLRHLYLSNNNISSLPIEIKNLINLSYLDLENNKLTQLPSWVVHLPKLKTLSISGNPISDIPPELLSSGYDQKANLPGLREYFAALAEEGEDHLYEAKVLILGEGEAGKTTLAKKIIDPAYKLNSNEHSTEGINVLNYSFVGDGGNNVQANLWDFGGQEIYHATHQFFLTKRSLYLLVADSRKEDTDFNYWLDVAQLYGGDSPLLIIKNEKQDRKRHINESELFGRFNRNLKEILATNLATNRGLEIITKSIEDYLQRLPHVGTPLPKTWVAVRRALEEHPADTISLTEYINICDENGYGVERAITLSGFLHDLGVILHFQDDPDSPLRNLVILKPEWGVDAAYAVLDNVKVVNNHGRFTSDDLNDIWADTRYEQRRPELLELMMKFNLCYQIPGRQEYIAPQLLDANQPIYFWDETDNLHLRYKYDFMPKGLILRLIVALHDLIEDQDNTVWRSGMVLADGEARAELIEVYRERGINIRVSGSGKLPLMRNISRELEMIHNSYQGRLSYKRLIPCQCTECRTAITPEFYEENILLRFRELDRPDIQCRRSFENVPVLPMIEDFSQFERLGVGDEIFDHDEVLARRWGRKPESKKEIYLSYPWDDKGNKLANTLQKTFRKHGITVRRDIDDMGYKDRIKSYMQKIGHGHVVLAIIDNKYLKSPNCMYELLQIYQNGDFEKRIFPIVLKSAKFYEPEDQVALYRHWTKRIENLDKQVKELNLGVSQITKLGTDFVLLDEIRHELPHMIQILKDLNTLTIELHTKENFNQLITQVLERLNE